MQKNKDVKNDIKIIQNTLNELQYDFNKLKTITGKSLIVHLKTIVSNTENLLDTYDLEQK